MKPEFDGRVPLLHLMGGWEPSRAANPSNGDDPISLGLLGAPASAPPAPPSAALPSPPMVHEPAQQHSSTPLENMSPTAPGNVLLLDSGQVHLLGRSFVLPASMMQAIMYYVLEGYVATAQAEAASIAQFFGMFPQPSEREALPEADTEPAVVPAVPGQTAPTEPALSGQPSPADVQPLSRGAGGRKAVRALRRKPAGGQAPAPDA